MFSTKRFKSEGTSSQNAASTASPKAPLIVRFYDPQEQAGDAHGRTLNQILSWTDNELERCHNYIQMLFPVPEGSAFNWEAPIINRQTMDAFRSRVDLRRSLRRSFERMMDFYGFQITYHYPKKDQTGQVKEKDVKTGGANGKTVEADGRGADSSSVVSNTALAAGSQTVVDKKPESQATTTTDKPATQNGAPSFPPGTSSNNLGSLAYHLIRSPHWRKSFNNWVRRFDHNHLRITRMLRCLRILGLQKECDAFFAALKEVYEDPAFNISGTSMDYWTRAVTRPLYIAPDNERIDWLRAWEGEQGAAKAAKDESGDKSKAEGEDKKVEGEDESKANGEDKSKAGGEEEKAGAV